MFITHFIFYGICEGYLCTLLGQSYKTIGLNYFHKRVVLRFYFALQRGCEHISDVFVQVPLFLFFGRVLLGLLCLYIIGVYIICRTPVQYCLFVFVYRLKNFTICSEYLWVFWCFFMSLLYNFQSGSWVFES